VLDLCLSHALIELELWFSFTALSCLLILVGQLWQLRCVLNYAKDLVLSFHYIPDLPPAEFVILHVGLDGDGDYDLFLELWGCQIVGALDDTFDFTHMNGVDEFEVVGEGAPDVLILFLGLLSII
jgi:hypothetical protein